MAGPFGGPSSGPSRHLTTKGYWLVAADGGVFTFGNAPFDGSMAASHLNAPVVGLNPSTSVSGYWLTALDGGVFTFGDAAFWGSASGTPYRVMAPLVSSPDQTGYWIPEAEQVSACLANGDVVATSTSGSTGSCDTGFASAG